MKTRMTRSSLVRAVLTLAAMLASGAAGAEDRIVIAQAGPPADSGGASASGESSDIEEIVVLGQESDAAADFAAGDSVTGFDASDLEALGAQSVEDLAAFTPNLEIVTSGATTPTFFIRGVGLNDFNANAASAVAVYEDDVPRNASGLALGTLFDMEAVNILRGPQGTGAARNASAGAIKLYSRKPTGEFGGYVRSSFGNYALRDYEGAVEAPIWEDLLAARFAFRYTDREGTQENGCGGLGGTPNGPNGTFLCRTGVPNVVGSTSLDVGVPGGLPEDVNNKHSWAARGTLLFQPTLDMTWLVGGHGSRRNEDSQLGVSYGTNQQVQLPGGDPDPNTPDLTSFLGGVDQSASTGSPRNFYKKPEVARAQRPLINKFRAKCDSLRGIRRRNCRAEQTGRALQKVAQDLAENLDSEPHRGYYDSVGPTINDTWGAYIKGDVVLPHALEVSSVTGVDTYDRFIDVDLDFSPTTLFSITTDDKVVQFTQDLKIAGDLGEGALPLSWELGGYYLQEDLDVEVINDLGALQVQGAKRRTYNQKIKSYGAYASFEWELGNDFTLDGGARYNIENKTLDFEVVLGEFLINPFRTFTDELDETWEAPTGTLRLTYRFREDTHAYWKYSRGWKAGHYNATASPFKGVSTADPETVDSFETGLRGAWFESRLGLDLSMFYYSYQDYQIFTVENEFGSLPSFVVLNADNAEVYGAEADLIIRPWLGAFANFRFSWLESQFLDFLQQQVTQRAGTQVNPAGQRILVSEIVVAEIDNSGNRLLNSPQFKISISAEQRIPLGPFGALTPRYDGVWTDTTFFDPSEGLGVPDGNGNLFLPEFTIAQKDFWLHNLRLSYTPPSGNMEIAIWARNIEDKNYKTFAADASAFQRTTIYFVGDPRTYGIDVSVNF